jgi:tetratricopeptide (TPR) repeat protein
MNTDAGKDPTRVFVSYAREDKKWLDPENPRNLIPFLEDSLRRQNVAFWYDKGLVPGDEFKRRIEAEIDRAEIALLIVSQYFLNSVFIETEEMPRIANRARLGQMVIMPILVESCDWNEYDFLADRQMVPASRPLIEFTDSDIRWSSVRKEILDGVKAQVKRIRAAQEKPPLQANQDGPIHDAELQKVDKRSVTAPPQPPPAIDPPSNNIKSANGLEERAAEADAMGLYKEKERLCRELGNKDGLNRALEGQANILYARGNLDDAMALYTEQEQVCREAGLMLGLGIVLGNQALILKARGDLDGAMALQKESERLCRETGNKDGLQLSLHNQGLIFYARGQLDDAMALYQEAADLCRELRNKDGLRCVLGNQALILKDRGDLDGAMALRKEEENICREIGNKDGLQASLGNQAAILAARKTRR